MLDRLGEQTRRGSSGEREPWPSVAAAVALAVAVGCAYFLAARLGLALLTEVEDVAVFWPASGVAAGALIALGRRASAPVAVGVIGATVAANLLGDRSLATALAFGLCNAGEAVLTAWLVGRWAARPFRLDSLQRVFVFLAAACIGAAVAAVGAALAMNLLHARVPLLSAWRVWASADGLGIIAIAPLLIGLHHLASERLPRRGLIEGASVLALLGALSAVVYAAPPDSWAAYVPTAVLFPVLLWVTGRCGPAFAAAAAFIVCSALVYATAFRLGRFSDPNTSLALHVTSAQVAMIVTVLCVLVLSALFAERRRNEAQLRESNERLRLALGGAELGVWSVDLGTGAFESDARDREVNGHDPLAPPRTLAEARTVVHPEDLPCLDAAFAAARQSGTPCRAEYRLRAAGGVDAVQPRWVAVEGTVVRNGAGRPPRLLGVTRDITERKRAEDNLRKHEQALRNLLGALPAAIFTADADGRLTYYNQGAVDLWGVAPELGKDRWWSNCRFHRTDGTRMPPEECPTEIALREGRTVRDLEAILERADGTRVPVIPYPTPLRDERGAIVGVVNMTVDISERKKAEAALAERNAQLALAGQAGLVGSYTHDIGSGIMQVSTGWATIYGLPGNTTTITRRDWRARVHPDDLAGLDARRARVFADRQREHRSEFRILRADGDIRWIESRSVVAYDDDGFARRMVGVNIDVTERKQAEEHKNLLVAELDHRVKNVLAVVAAVVSRTLEASASMADFAVALDGRIQSIATTHELLSWRKWQGIPLAELVERELAPHANGSNMLIEGPEVVLRPEVGQALAMVLHELATNAAKYGALSAQQGGVAVRWRPTAQNGSGGVLVIDWIETGGPAVVAAPHAGYGTSIIRDLIPYEFGGTVDLGLTPEGARCRLEIPAAWIGTDAERARTPRTGSHAASALATDEADTAWR
jgi:PAS domain S-box-containing protein